MKDERKDVSIHAAVTSRHKKLAEATVRQDPRFKSVSDLFCWLIDSVCPGILDPDQDSCDVAFAAKRVLTKSAERMRVSENLAAVQHYLSQSDNDGTDKLKESRFLYYVGECNRVEQRIRERERTLKDVTRKARYNKELKDKITKMENQIEDLREMRADLDAHVQELASRLPDDRARALRRQNTLTARNNPRRPG